MLRIALFAEGYTDQVVIEQILLGGLMSDEEPAITFVQPLAPGPSANGSYAPGGWTVLFDALRAGEHRKALQANDLIVLHVDTDVCDQIGFGVHRVDDPEALAASVQAKLCDLLGADFCADHGDKVVFAIAVDEVECWFLPLLFADLPAKRRKTTGCLEAVDRELGRREQPRLLRADSKQPAAYRALAREFGDAKKLARCASMNPSLGRFFTAWQAWQSEFGALMTAR